MWFKSLLAKRNDTEPSSPPSNPNPNSLPLSSKSSTRFSTSGLRTKLNVKQWLSKRSTFLSAGKTNHTLTPSPPSPHSSAHISNQPVSPPLSWSAFSPPEDNHPSPNFNSQGSASASPSAFQGTMSPRWSSSDYKRRSSSTISTSFFSSQVPLPSSSPSLYETSQETTQQTVPKLSRPKPPPLQTGLDLLSSSPGNGKEVRFALPSRHHNEEENTERMSYFSPSHQDSISITSSTPPSHSYSPSIAESYTSTLDGIFDEEVQGQVSHTMDTTTFEAKMSPATTSPPPTPPPPPRISSLFSNKALALKSWFGSLSRRPPSADKKKQRSVASTSSSDTSEVEVDSGETTNSKGLGHKYRSSLTLLQGRQKQHHQSKLRESVTFSELQHFSVASLNGEPWMLDPEGASTQRSTGEWEENSGMLLLSPKQRSPPVLDRRNQSIRRRHQLQKQQQQIEHFRSYSTASSTSASSRYANKNNLEGAYLQRQKKRLTGVFKRESIIMTYSDMELVFSDQELAQIGSQRGRDNGR